ncbi:MAG TPA: DUF6443 domain-containing protein, partial [Pedobacter sp.]|nr:DUF6443 domain-containing protein [Pedobacter sp.]
MKSTFNFIALLLAFVCASVKAQTPTSTRNYVIETTVKVKGKKTVASLTGLPVDSVNKTITYINSVGRPVQTIEWQGSPTKRDVVLPAAYDALGQEAKIFLPYSATTALSNGSFKTNAISAQKSYFTTAADLGVRKTDTAFTEKRFEASPLNRLLEQAAPGLSWKMSSGHTQKTEYLSNNTSTSYTTSGFAVRLY